MTLYSRYPPELEEWYAVAKDPAPGVSPTLFVSGGTPRGAWRTAAVYFVACT